jgi:hypothetical protein
MRYLYQRSPTVRAFEQAVGMRDPRDAIVACAIDLLAEVGIDKPPVDLRIVASYQRVKEIQRVRMSHAGRLIPIGSDYIIQVNASDNPARQNFTLAHEIGHTLLQRYQATPHRIEDRTTGYFPQQEEEYLCDLAAAELLMPSSFWWPLVEGKEVSLSLVDELSQVFGSSRQATAIRLVHTDLWPCAFVIWHQLDGLSLSRANFGIQYIVSSPSFGYLLPRDLAVRANGCLARCFRYGGVVCGEERFDVGQQSISLYVMAAAIDIHITYRDRFRQIYCFFLSR